jgi:hypothetical protein
VKSIQYFAGLSRRGTLFGFSFEGGKTMCDIVFFDTLTDALQATRGTSLVVIDGPEHNYAVMDPDTAQEILDTDKPVIGYSFWPIALAQAFDEARIAERELEETGE